MRIADSSDAKYVLLPFSAVISERSLSLSLRASKPCFEPTNIENGPFISALEYAVLRTVYTFCFSSGIRSITSHSGAANICAAVSSLKP